MSRRFLALVALMSSSPLWGQYIVTEKTYDEYLDAITGDRNYYAVSNLWMVIAAAMVFVMHLGFATLEAGLTRQKNTVNVLIENVFIICAGIFLYGLTGFRSMYPPETWNGLFHFDFWISVDPKDYLDLMTAKYDDGTISWWSDFVFQAMFAAAAASIVSGAVAERIKLSAFQIFVVLLLGLAYPVAGSWAWSPGGWLAKDGFMDSAGGAVVHAFGGFAALGIVLILGPRKGRYLPDGTIRPHPGHSLPLMVAGMFFLWFGWFGFNGGAVGGGGVLGGANPEVLGRVFVNTALGGSLGGLACMLTTQFVLKRPDLSMFANGVLAGLVSVTGGGQFLYPTTAAIVGAVGGVLVVFSVLLFDRLKIDDPVGAISVHAVCGTWGILALGTPLGIGWKQLPVQAWGILTYALVAFGFAVLVALALRHTIGLRVSEEDEDRGLDLSEHGQEAYAHELPAPATVART